MQEINDYATSKIYGLGALAGWAVLVAWSMLPAVVDVMNGNTPWVFIATPVFYTTWLGWLAAIVGAVSFKWIRAEAISGRIRQAAFNSILTTIGSSFLLVVFFTIFRPSGRNPTDVLLPTFTITSIVAVSLGFAVFVWSRRAKF